MIQDNTTKWKVRKFTDFASNQALPVGYVHWSISPIVPAGELPLLGGTYDRSLYADLWSWANENGLVISESEWQANVLADGKCDKFSDGNGSSTFRVPKLPNTLTADIADELAVKGNGLNLGFTDGKNNFALATGNASNMVVSGVPYYGQSIGTKWSGGGTYPAEYSLGITTDSTKSGIVAKTSATKITGQWLIVAFGTVSNVGNADVANVMQAVEQVQTGLGKVDGIADYIIESYRNGSSWYEVYKSGKVRQGGLISITETNFEGKVYTVTLNKQMRDTNYMPLVIGGSSSNNPFIYSVKTGTKTTTAFSYVFAHKYSVPSSPKEMYWEVQG